MRFLYKIHSGYNGFYPKRIPDRLENGTYLQLMWGRYLDVVKKGDEVWVYFRGPHVFENGVYLKGRIHDIQLDAQKAILRVFQYKIESPLTNARDSKRAASITEPRYRQVFVLPDDWEGVTSCSIFTTGESCSKRECEWCADWQALPRIEEDQLKCPPHLGLSISNYVPAYWAIPARCFIPSSRISKKFHMLTQILASFKTGNANLAYPLARGIFETFKARHVDMDFDCIIPIPLSPEKEKRGEIHRTHLLAEELSKLMNITVREYLTLDKPISKRMMLSAGYTYGQFVKKYAKLLVVDSRVNKYKRVLIVDDVCTHGGTLGVSYRELHTLVPQLDIVATPACQMIVVSALKHKSIVVK